MKLNIFVVSSILMFCSATASAQSTNIKEIEDLSGNILGHYYGGLGHLTICARRFGAGKSFLDLYVRNNGDIAKKVETRLFSELQRQKDSAYVLNVRNETAKLKSETLLESSFPEHAITQEGCQLAWNITQNRTLDLDGKYRMEIYVLLGQISR